jgi:hypothetical protein
MNDRHTLETDTNVEDIGMGCHMVGADFARKLERERDEANYFLNELAEVDGQLKFRINELCEVLRKTEKERDEAREKYDMEATEHMLAVNKLCNDRDKALKELELIKEQYGR